MLLLLLLFIIINCFPFGVIVFTMFPVHGIWRETVSLLDVMWPWTMNGRAVAGKTPAYGNWYWYKYSADNRSQARSNWPRLASYSIICSLARTNFQNSHLALRRCVWRGIWGMPSTPQSSEWRSSKVRGGLFDFWWRGGGGVVQSPTKYRAYASGLKKNILQNS